MVPYLDDLLGKWADRENRTTPSTLPPTKPTPITLPTYPKTTAQANFGNFGPILMKIDGEVKVGITKIKIQFGVPGAMFRPLQPPYPPLLQPLW